MNKKWLFIAFVVLNIVMLCGLASVPYYIEQTGTKVTLKIEPIDPRDPFYGDFVYLSYKIQDLPYALYKGSGNLLEHSQMVYVKLKKKGTSWDAIGIYDQRPTIGKDEVVLKGRCNQRYQAENGEKRLQIDYGIHRYYVKEGTGKQFEQPGKITEATIMVAPYGQAKVISIK